MCGVVALFDPRQDAERVSATARSMVARIRHRGPDGEGVWTAKTSPLALGHCRLAVRGLGAQGAQPMEDELGRGVLSFNGELFGVEPTRSDLERLGVVFRGTSDTEVLAEALSHWGVEETLSRIHGQFAFAWWEHEKQRLVLARDPIGIRPMYWSAAGGRFAAASEQKALLGLTWLDRTPSERAMLRYLLMGRTDEVPGECMLEGVRSLEPGHFLVWDGTVARKTRYCRIPVDVPPASVSDVRRELERCITEQLVADVTVGCMVSGGLDSSTVLALADRARVEAGTREPMHLFAYHDSQAESDEREFQQAAIEAVQSPKVVHWISSSPRQLGAELDSYVEHQEEPYGDVSSYAEYCIARRAKESGVKVLLAGLGGDEVFLGYPAFMGPAMLDLLEHFDLRSAAGMLRVSSALAASGDASPRPALAAAYHAVPAPIRNAATAWRSARGTALTRRARVRGCADAASTWHRHDGSRHANAAQRGSIESWCIPRYVLHSDRMTLAHGVEGRVPLLDVRLIEVAFGVPVSQRVGPRGLKESLRRAAEDVLPALVRERRWKQGFHAPLRAYVKELDAALEGRARWAAHAMHQRLKWHDLSVHARWRWGNLGAYLQWIGAWP